MTEDKKGEERFDLPSSSYKGSNFPDREACPRWIMYPCDYNEGERVEVLLRAVNPKKVFVPYFARSKCPPTCTCSYRFETDFPLDESRGQEKRVYCHAQEIISAAIENEIHKSRKPILYEAEKPTEQVSEPGKKRKTQRVLTSLEELSPGSHHPHQHHGEDHQRQRRT